MRAFLLLFSFLLAFPLWSQWTISKEIFIPPEYYVGDDVVYEIQVDLDNPMLLEVPSDLPQQDWLEWGTISVDQQGDMALIRIQFRSYYPGIRTLPPLDFGGIELRGRSIFTSSVSEQMGIQDIRGLRDPFQLPGSIFLALLFLILLISSPPLLFFLIRFVLGRVKMILLRIKLRAPYRRFQRVLLLLGSSEEKQNGKEFYAHLAGGIRAYLSDKTNMDYNSCTTREMSNRVIPGLDRKDWHKILGILKTADMVKYAGERAKPGLMEETLQWIEQFALSWEEEKNAHL